MTVLRLDLTADVVDLTRAICDIESVSGDEKRLADAVEAAVRELPHLEVLRDGDAVLARTNLGRSSRVVIAGHLDTVPLRRPEPNLPTWVVGADLREHGGEDERIIYGRGTADMKSGVAVQLSVAAELSEPAHDITWIWYDNEEVEASRNGLGRIARNHPDWLVGDFAVLGEPSSGGVEGGCQGTIRVEVRTRGKAAHSARAWFGVNAIHAAEEILHRLNQYQTGIEPASVEPGAARAGFRLRDEVLVDGLAYRESMSAVGVRGGTAGNVIPDECVVLVNYRFAPSRSIAEAEHHLRALFEGFEVVVTDAAPGARPGLQHPAAADFVAAVGREPTAKYGWTDVARFSEMGVPAVNFGPAEAILSHTDDEHCPAAAITACRAALARWLGGDHTD